MRKSPVSRLSELCDYNGVQAKYSLQTTDGESHKRSFGIKCRVMSFETMAFGSSKKRAKHRTASLMLQQLVKSDELPIKKDVAFENWDPEDDKCFWNSPEISSENEEPVVNCVGKLLEMCLKMKLTAPRFEDYEMEESNKQKWFSVTCSISELNGLISEGKGSKKQIAKREAAAKMIETISKLNAKQKDDSVFREKFSEYGNHSESSSENEDNANDATIKRFIGQLSGEKRRQNKDIDSQKFIDLIEEKPREDYCYRLKQLMVNNDCKVKYLRVPSLSKSGKHQFLLKVFRKSISRINVPYFTAWGSGSNGSLARQDAARNMITLYFS